MMASRSLNKVLLIGNLTRDPELRYTPQGTAVCTFGLATNRTWVDSSNQKQEEAEFHRIVAWHKLAELCSQLLFKGRKVYVEGRLQTRHWTSADGQERITTEVVIDNMIVLDSRRKPEEGEVPFGEQISKPVVAESLPATEKTPSPAKKTEDNEKNEKRVKKEEKSASKEDKKEEVSADDIPF